MEAPSGFDESFFDETHYIEFRSIEERNNFLEIYKIGVTKEHKNDPINRPQSKSKYDKKSTKSEAVSCVHEYDEIGICEKCGWSKNEVEGKLDKNLSDQKYEKVKQVLRGTIKAKNLVIKFISAPIFRFASIILFWKDKKEVYKISYKSAMFIATIFIFILVISIFSDPSKESRAASACAEKVREEYEDPTLYGRMKPETGMADESSDYPGQVLSLEEDEYLVSGFAATEYIDPEGLTGDAYSGYAFSCKVEVTKDAADIVSFQAPESLNEK